MKLKYKKPKINKNLVININSILLMFFLLISCELFTTRNPENPDDSAVNYLPATTTDILLSNFNQSFVGLNPENYYDCFVKIDNFFTNDYSYLPDPNALARYGVVFSNWNAENERSFLIGLKSSLEANIKPELTWNNTNYEVLTSDSAIYYGEYNLTVTLQKKIENYSGIARMTFVRSNSGLWYIKNWQDIQLGNSDTTKTFSILKAMISV